MAKKLSYQVLEDNGGGLHLAVFSGDECIYYASGLEHLPVADVQEMFQALRDGAHHVSTERHPAYITPPRRKRKDTLYYRIDTSCTCTSG